MSVCGDNTTPLSNDSVAQLGPIVRSRVPAGADIRRTQTMLVQWWYPDTKEVNKQAYPTPLGALQPWTKPRLTDSKLQAMTKQSEMPVSCSGYNNPYGKRVPTGIHTVYGKNQRKMNRRCKSQNCEERTELRRGLTPTTILYRYYNSTGTWK